MSVGRSVRRSVRRSVSHIFEFRAVFALLLLPNRPRLDCRVSGLVTYEMQELEMTHSDVHHHFSNGLYLVCRIDRLWAGIPSDQVIEQCLVLNLKISGGLTYGSGMSEEQRNVWTLSMPFCASAYQVIQ